MNEAIFVRPSGQLRFTAGTAYVTGQVIQVNGSSRAGVVETDLASGETGSIATTGVFRLPANSGAGLSDGDAVYWDDDPGECVASGGTGDYYLGRAVADQDSNNFVEVDINANIDPAFADFSELPTSDPSVAGQLYSNAGVVTVSAG